MDESWELLEEAVEWICPHTEAVAERNRRKAEAAKIEPGRVWCSNCSNYVHSDTTLFGTHQGGACSERTCQMSEAKTDHDRLVCLLNREPTFSEMAMYGKWQADVDARKTKCRNGHPFDGKSVYGWRTCSVCKREIYDVRYKEKQMRTRQVLSDVCSCADPSELTCGDSEPESANGTKT